MESDDPPGLRPAAPSNVKPSREERMAAKLRENLRRRKQQARARSHDEPVSEAAGPTPSDMAAGSALPKREDGG